ncbi:hypothetical protein [Catellatospora methionotrophica]|uniref:hypothetical protein n=1 Tax=Catellatospora methionotrophica TaxID=121620 RepID=UPI0033F7D698
MLVPFFGIGSAALFLGEPPPGPDVIAGALVTGGVLLGASGRNLPAAPDSAARPRHATSHEPDQHLVAAGCRVASGT